MKIKVGGILKFDNLPKESQDKIKERLAEKYKLPEGRTKTEVLDKLCGKGQWEEK